MPDDTAEKVPVSAACAEGKEHADAKDKKLNAQEDADMKETNQKTRCACGCSESEGETPPTPAPAGETPAPDLTTEKLKPAPT